MLKRFNYWKSLKKEEIFESLNEQVEFVNLDLFNEAIQGNVTKETIPHLFSDDTIKYLYQFDPKDWAKAEYQRYQILYDAMADRQEYYKDFFSKYYEEEKQNLKKIFDEQKALTKLYFNDSLTQTIINTCAQRNSFEKINKEKLDDWWKDSSANGGKKYLEKFDIVGATAKKSGTPVRTYSVDLYLKDMVNRIEKKAESHTGADLSFPQEWHIINNATGKSETIKRFTGMILPSEKSIKDNIEEWKSSVANKMLSKNNPEHGKPHAIKHYRTPLSGDVGETVKINYHRSNKENTELYDIESVILKKELRKIFEDSDWAVEGKDINKEIDHLKKEIQKLEKDNPADKDIQISRNEKEIQILEDNKKDIYNRFILDLINIFPFTKEIFDSMEKSEVAGTIMLNDPKEFIKRIVELSDSDKKALNKIITSIEGSKGENPAYYYKKVIETANEDFVKVTANSSLMNSFSNLLVAKQFIDWAKKGNIKSMNPDKSIESAKINEFGELELPKIYQPTFAKYITYLDKKGQEHQELIENMPYLLPGKVLKEKSRAELEAGEAAESDLGADMWNPYHQKFQHRYTDKSGERFAGIQGSEDKLKGGLRPNQNIETFDFMCPSEEDKDKADNFWTRLKKIIKNNDGLSVAEIKKSEKESFILSTIERKDISKEEKSNLLQDEMPKIKFSKYGTSSDKNTVITGIAKQIWNNLQVNTIYEQKEQYPERLRLANNFMEVYNIIFAKIISNLGDIGMTDQAYLKKFINQKLQILMQKEIVSGRGARTTREETLKTSAKEYESPFKQVEKGYATSNIQRYVYALESHGLHICRTSKKITACEKCADPLTDNCEIFMENEEYHSNVKDLEKLFKLLHETSRRYKKPRYEPESMPKISIPTIIPPVLTTPVPKTLAATTPMPIAATTPIPIAATTPKPIAATTPTPIVSTTPVPVSKSEEKIAPSLHEEKEYIMHIETSIVQKFANIIFSQLENQRLAYAQDRFKKMSDVYTSQSIAGEEAEKLIEQADKEYEQLIKNLDTDRNVLKIKLSKLVQETKDFEEAAKTIIKTYDLKDVENTLKKENLI